MSSIYDPKSEDFLNSLFDFDRASGESSTQHFNSACEEALRDIGPLHASTLHRVGIEGAELPQQTDGHLLADNTTYDINPNAAGRFISTQHLGSILQDGSLGIHDNWSFQHHQASDESNNFPAGYAWDNSRSLQDFQPPSEIDGVRTACKTDFALHPFTYTDSQPTYTKSEMANDGGLVGADAESSHCVTCNHQMGKPIKASFFFRPTLTGQAV